MFMIFQGTILLPILFLLPIILIIPAIAFFIIFFIKFIKTKQHILGYLALLFLTFVMKNLFQIIIHTSPNESAAINSFIIFRIAEMFMLFSFVIVIEMFERNIQFSLRIIILIVLVFTTIGSYVTNQGIQATQITTIIGEVYFADFEKPLNFTTIIHSIFNITGGIWLLISLYRSKKYAWNDDQKKLINWLFIGLILGILLPSGAILDLGLLGERTSNLLIGRSFAREILEPIGMLIVGIAFYKTVDNPWLLQRQRIHLLMVYSQDGLELYSENFSKELAENDNLLLAGGFSAITSLFKEATKSAGPINAILLEDKELWLKNRKYFVCALLVDYMTEASQLAFQNFVNDFEKKFNEDLRNFEGEISKFQSAKEMARKYFT